MSDLIDCFPFRVQRVSSHHVFESNTSYLNPVLLVPFLPCMCQVASVSPPNSVTLWTVALQASLSMGFSGVWVDTKRTVAIEVVLFFLAALGLRCCWWTFSNWGTWGLLSTCGVRASHCGGFSCCESRALENRLQSCGTLP